MTVGAWRVAIWVGILVTLFVIGGDVILQTRSGTFGYTAQPESLETSVVQSVTPKGPAARAGIVAGDRLRLGDDSMATRVYADGGNAPGDQLPLWVTHAGVRRHVVLRADANPRSNAALVLLSYEILRIVFLAIAALLVVRRSERADARALATFYVAFAFGFLGRPPWYGPWIRLLLMFARPACVAYALERAAYFTAVFPQPARAGIRALLPRISRWMLTVTIAVFALPALTTFIIYVPSTATPGITAAIVVSLSYFLIAIVAGLVLGGRDASPADRARLRWIGVSFVVGLTFVILAVGLELAGVPERNYYLLPLGLLAIPIGSAYAILRHRLLDLGFVINRALVFAILSGLVVAAFSLLEFILGRYLFEVGHVESVALEAGLALLIALSLRTVHERVDGFVDSVFFRQRHLAEQALGRLTREVAHITDRTTIVERAIAAVDRHLAAAGSALYLRGLEGILRLADGTLAEAPAALAENDPVVVRLKTFRDAVDLSELAEEGARSQLPALLALPLIVRGDIVGALAVGARRDEEAYGPDEVAALVDLALAVGIAIDSLETQALRNAVDLVLSGGAALETLRIVHSPADS